MRLVRKLVPVLALVGVVLTAFAWAVASPVGAAPDEPAHIYYAWGTATGQTLPRHERTTTDSLKRTADVVEVPQQLTRYMEPGCFAHKDIVASCVVPPSGSGTVTVTTYMTRYPPLYYAVIGTGMRILFAVGLSGVQVLLAARIASGILSLGTLAIAGAILLRRFHAVGVVAALAAATVPLEYFLASSINPNGLEIALAGLLAALVVATRHDLGERGRPSSLVAFGLPAVALMLAWTRPVGIVWACALLVVLLWPVRGRRRPALLRLGAVPVLLTIAAIAAGGAWFLYQAAGSPQEASTTGKLDAWDELPGSVQWLVILFRFGDMAQSGFGTMGWLDTQLPTFVFILWVVVAVACLASLATGAVAPSTRPRAALVVILLSMIAIAVESYVAAFGWQGRYWYPAIVGAVILLVPALQGRAVSPGRRRVIAGTVVLVNAAIMLTALAFDVERYRYGWAKTFERFQNLPWNENGDLHWNPAGGVHLMWFAAVVGALLLILACALTVSRESAVEQGATSTGRLEDDAHLSLDVVTAVPAGSAPERNPTPRVDGA